MSDQLRKCGHPLGATSWCPDCELAEARASGEFRNGYAASAPALQGEPRIFRDGNQWCAVGPGFKNLQESPAGFGDTPDAALYALSLDTPGNRNPECRYAGYKGEALPSNATDDQKAAWQEGKRASLHADLVTCNHCSGSGKVKHDDFNPTQSSCPHCDGEGAK